MCQIIIVFVYKIIGNILRRVWYVYQTYTVIRHQILVKL